MNKFVIAVLCLSLFLDNSLWCQENEIDHIKVASAVEQLNVNSSNLTSVDLRSKKLVGSPYIDKAFQSGRIVGQETVYAFRYDAFKDEMEVELQGRAYYMPIPLYLKIEFLNSGKIYEVLKNAPGAETEKGFYLPFVVGDEISLYRKELVKFYEEVPAKLGFTKYEPPKLKRTKDTFFIVKDRTAYTVPKKKKELLQFFPGREKEVESFLKKQKINLKKEDDLVKLFNHFNTMR